MKFKPSQCHLFRIQVETLGRVLSRKGVSMTPEHLRCIQEWPRPRTPQEASKFAGFINYHREFIQGLAKLIKPIDTLTKVDMANYEWANECENSFIN